MKKTPSQQGIKPVMHNNTPCTPEAVRQFVFLGATINKWRGRFVQLYAHPTDPALLVSWGTSLDRRMIVIAVEPRTAWSTALDYAAHGKMYVSE